MEKEIKKGKNWFLDIGGEDVICENTIYVRFYRQDAHGERVLDKNKNKKYKDGYGNEVRPIGLSVEDIKEIIIDNFNSIYYRRTTIIVFEKEGNIYTMRCPNTIAAEIDIINFYSDIVEKDGVKFNIKADNLPRGFKESLVFIKDRMANQFQIGIRENPSVKDFLEVLNLDKFSTDMLYLANGTLWAYIGVGTKYKFGYQTDRETKKKNLIIKSSEESPILINLEVLSAVQRYEMLYLGDISKITKTYSIEKFREYLANEQSNIKGISGSGIPTQFFTWKDSYLDLIKKDNWNSKYLNKIYLERIKDLLEHIIFRKESYITNRDDAINFSNFWINSTQKTSGLNEIQKTLSSIITPAGSMINSTDELLRIFDIEIDKLHFLDDINLFKAGDWFLNNGKLYYIVKTADKLKYSVDKNLSILKTVLKNKKNISNDNLLVIDIDIYRDVRLNLKFITKEDYSYMYKSNIPNTISNYFKSHSIDELGVKYKSIDMDGCDKTSFFSRLIDSDILSQFERVLLRDKIIINNDMLIFQGAYHSTIFEQLAAIEKTHPLLESIEDFDDFMLNVEDFICERREG